MPVPPTETPYTWHEALSQRTQHAQHASDVAVRVKHGDFGRLRPVTSVDRYAMQPTRATFTVDDAAHVQQTHTEWQARIDALQESVKALRQQKAMAVTVQRALAVQLMHQYVHDRTDTVERTPLTLWETCLQKAQRSNLKISK